MVIRVDSRSGEEREDNISGGASVEGVVEGKEEGKEEGGGTTSWAA